MAGLEEDKDENMLSAGVVQAEVDEEDMIPLLKELYNARCQELTALDSELQ